MVENEITIIIPIVAGLVQAISKPIGLISEVKPIVSIIVGIIVSFLMLGGNDVQSIIMSGIVAGLSASGLYDVAKKTITRYIIKRTI